MKKINMVRHDLDPHHPERKKRLHSRCALDSFKDIIIMQLHN